MYGMFDTKRRLPGERKPVFPEARRAYPGRSAGIPAARRQPGEEASEPAAQEATRPRNKGGGDAAREEGEAGAQATAAHRRRAKEAGRIREAARGRARQAVVDALAAQQQTQSQAAWPQPAQRQTSPTAPWPAAPPPGTFYAERGHLLILFSPSNNINVAVLWRIPFWAEDHSVLLSRSHFSPANRPPLRRKMLKPAAPMGLTSDWRATHRSASRSLSTGWSARASPSSPLSQGVTRDRREGVNSLGALDFTVIDTAGFEKNPAPSLVGRMRAQTEAAIAAAERGDVSY